MLHVEALQSYYSAFPFTKVSSPSFPHTKNAAVLFFNSIFRLSVFFDGGRGVIPPFTGASSIAFPQITFTCLFVALIFFRMSCASICLLRGSIVTTDQWQVVTSLIDNRKKKSPCAARFCRTSESTSFFQRERERGGGKWETIIETEKHIHTETMRDALWCQKNIFWMSSVDLTSVSMWSQHECHIFTICFMSLLMVPCRLWGLMVEPMLCYHGWPFTAAEKTVHIPWRQQLSLIRLFSVFLLISVGFVSDTKQLGTVPRFKDVISNGLEGQPWDLD